VRAAPLVHRQGRPRGHPPGHPVADGAAGRRVGRQRREPRAGDRDRR
jgi:hypothetical protein